MMPGEQWWPVHDADRDRYRRAIADAYGFPIAVVTPGAALPRRRWARLRRWLRRHA